VAAQGHLWGHTGERGVFKTIDGGKTWQRLTAGLPDDGRTGATDIKMDPRDPNGVRGEWSMRSSPLRQRRSTADLVDRRGRTEEMTADRRRADGQDRLYRSPRRTS
jgi:hypothetical protein